MGHCISGFITKKSNISDDSKNYLKLKQDFILFLRLDDMVFIECDYVDLYTDYFGGVGEQYAAFYKDGVCLYENNNSFGAINLALKDLDVIVEEGKDEFDTLGLGRYRSNWEIENIIMNENQNNSSGG